MENKFILGKLSSVLKVEKLNHLSTRMKFLT